MLPLFLMMLTWKSVQQQLSGLMAYCGLKTSIRFVYHTISLGTKYSAIMCALIAGPVLPIKEKFAFVLAEFLFKKEFLTNFWKNLSRKQGNHGRIYGSGQWYGAPPFFCDMFYYF